MAHVSPEVALAISRQKVRYGRYADTKQWDRFDREIGLPGARYAYCDPSGTPLDMLGRPLVFDSPTGCAAFFKRFFAGLDTLHNMAPGDFEQVAPDEVKAVFGFEDQLVSKALGGWGEYRGGGFYYETWKLVDGQWYIQDLKMVRSYTKSTFLFKVQLVLWAVFGF